jgi:RNA polymerase sigma-70 factor (ECF subfamily)
MSSAAPSINLDGRAIRYGAAETISAAVAINSSMAEPEDRTDAQRQFEALFRAHYGAVRSYVRRRVSEGAVDDAVAETFLVAWRRVDRAPAEPLPWLLSIARKTLSTHTRSATRRNRLVDRLRLQRHEIAAPGPDETHVATGFGEVVQALSRLSPTEREALTLVAWDGLAPREVATVLGEPAATVRVRLHRAKAHLRRELDHGIDPNDPRPATPVLKCMSEGGTRR